MVQPEVNTRFRETVGGTALTSLAFLAAAYLPIIGFFGLLALPVLVLYFRTKLGRHAGAIVAIVTGGVVVIALGGPTPDLLIVGGLLLMGFVLGELLERRLALEATLIYACATVVGAGLIGLMIYGNLTGTSLGTLLSTYIAQSLKLSIALYDEMGVPAEQVERIRQSMDTIQYVLVRILPGLCLAATLVVAWLTVLATRPVLIKKGLDCPDFGPLNRWQAPEVLVWGAIAAGLLLLMPPSGAKIIGGNLMIVLATIYFFQGVAILSFYFERKSLPTALKVVLFALVLLWQPLLLGIVALGFFDMWLDVRRLNHSINPTNGNAEGDDAADSGPDNGPDDKE